MHSIFKICISRNMKCDKTVGFLKYSHNFGRSNTVNVAHALRYTMLQIISDNCTVVTGSPQEVIVIFKEYFCEKLENRTFTKSFEQDFCIYLFVTTIYHTVHDL